MDSYRVYLFVLMMLHHAQYVVGQCDATTRPLDLTASSNAQYFTSPNYPADYPSNVHCEWRVTSTGLYDQVIINIEEFFTERLNDLLLVYDGFDETGTLIATMDKSNRYDYNALVSSGGTMFFNFTSNGDTEFVGFQILYFSNDISTQYPCGTTISVTATEQVLMSPNLPYPYISNDSCYWSFEATDAILFQIKLMDMQCGGTAQLSIYDGNGTADLLDSICETSRVYEFTDVLSTMTTAYINWIVLDEVTDFYGFMLTFRLDGPENIYTICNDTGYNITAIIDPKFDYLESPDFGTSNYPSNSECTWYITAPQNFSVQVTFDQTLYGIEYNYYCSWDYVILYDGHNTTDRQLNRLCGHSVPGYSYRSTDRYMLIIFSSDYALEYSGFRLIVTAKENTYPGCVDNYTEYSVTYNTKYIYHFNNETYINNISSPNFGSYYSYYGNYGYPSNLELFWLFTNDNTTYYTMVLDILSVSIESAYDCLYDKLILYDGPCIADGILDKVCGYWAKRWDLEGPEYLLHFHTDNSFNYGGFQLEYYAEENILTPPPTTPRSTTNGPPVEAVVNAIKDMLTNYSSENFPTKNISQAITASLDFFLVGINGIDEVEQKMTSTGQFEVTWRDESMSWDPTKRQGIIKILLPQNDLWKPDIALMNGFAKITAMGSSFMFIDVDYEGNCIWKPYQIMESVCKVDLTHYPYDRQTCVLKFGTWGTDDNEVVTELGALGLQIHPNFQDHAEWRLISHRTEQEDNNHHKVVEFFLTLERNPQYVSYYMTLPIVMLAYLNVFTFVIPTESGEKTGFSITLFLSFVVLLIITNSSMPDNSDSISLYAAYLLILTVMSAIGLMICVLQVKALTLLERRYPRFSCLAKTVRAVTKFRSFISCRSEKSKDIESIGKINVDDSDKEKLLDDRVSEHSFYEAKLKKKRSVAFVDEDINSYGERTPVGLLDNEKPNDHELVRDTTLFMEYADMRQPTQATSMLVAQHSEGDDASYTSNPAVAVSPRKKDTDSDSTDCSDDQLPESNIMQVKSVTEHNLPSRSSSKSITKTVSFGGRTDDILTPMAIERPVTVHNAMGINKDELANADTTQSLVYNSAEHFHDNESQSGSNHAINTTSDAPNEVNMNGLSLYSVERRKSAVSIQSYKDKDQLPQSREATSDFDNHDAVENEQNSRNDVHSTTSVINNKESEEQVNGTRRGSEVSNSNTFDVRDYPSSENVGNEQLPGEFNNTPEPRKHLSDVTNAVNYETEAIGISSNSGIAVEPQFDTKLTQSSQSPLLKNEDDHKLNVAVLESDYTGSGTLVDSVSTKQPSDAVEYRMMRPSSATESRPYSRGSLQTDATSRPLSSAMMFADQRPISRQLRMSSKNLHSFDQSSSDRRPLSRPFSRGNDTQWAVNQKPVSRMSQRIGIGLMGQHWKLNVFLMT